MASLFCIVAAAAAAAARSVLVIKEHVNTLVSSAVFTRRFQCQPSLTELPLLLSVVQQGDDLLHLLSQGEAAQAQQQHQQLKQQQQ